MTAALTSLFFGLLFLTSVPCLATTESAFQAWEASVTPLERSRLSRPYLRRVDESLRVLTRWLAAKQIFEEVSDWDAPRAAPTPMAEEGHGAALSAGHAAPR